MACFVPFNNKNLEISFYAFRPMVVLVDELLDALKHFSLSTSSLGCLHSAVFRSIHGNMIIWYGAWMKRSDENKKLLNAKLLSMLTNVSSMAILVDHSFSDACVGESRDGSSAVRFSTGDTISMNAIILPKDDDMNDLPYACLAIFRSRFAKMDGAVSGVCFNCQNQNQTRAVSLFAWKSLQLCYSWILTSDYRKTILPYFDNLPLQFKYDIFRVVYVSSDDVLNFQSNLSSSSNVEK